MTLTHLSMQHKIDTEWHEKYFLSPAYRLTAITESYLPSAYYEHFSSVYESMSSHLLFRAKFSNKVEKKVNVLTVWDSAQAYEEFYVRINGANWFEQLQKTKINFSFRKDVIDEFKLSQIISECWNQDRIIFQDVAAKFQTPNMKIGDPFKKKME